MPFFNVRSLVTNGELLAAILERLGFRSGKEELSTFSVKDLFIIACDYLQARRGITLEGQPDDAYISAAAVRESVEFLLNRLRRSGLIVPWDGEAVHYTQDPERYCSAPGPDSYFLLKDFHILANALTDQPEYPKNQRFWGRPEMLVANRNLLCKAVKTVGRALEEVASILQIYLASYEQELDLLPGREQVLAATYRFCWLVLRLRSTHQRIKWAAPISRKESLLTLFELQSVFIHHRAVWWLHAVSNLFVTLKWIGKLPSYPYQILVSESYRQEAVREAIRKFDVKTARCLKDPFLDFTWLNTPFNIWGRQTDNTHGVLVEIPYFEFMLL